MMKSIMNGVNLGVRMVIQNSSAKPQAVGRKRLVSYPSIMYRRACIGLTHHLIEISTVVSKDSWIADGKAHTYCTIAGHPPNKPPRTVTEVSIKGCFERKIEL